jgi:hypothetical protein
MNAALQAFSILYASTQDMFSTCHGRKEYTRLQFNVQSGGRKKQTCQQYLFLITYKVRRNSVRCSVRRKKRTEKMA